jgi:hypothetical protein
MDVAASLFAQVSIIQNCPFLLPETPIHLLFAGCFVMFLGFILSDVRFPFGQSFIP